MQDIFERMQRIIADQFAVDLVDLVMSMEQEFAINEVREEELATLHTVGDCVEFLTKRLDK